MTDLRQRITSGITFGAWVTSGHPLACEIMSRASYDWLILDTQHRGLSPEAVLSAVQAMELGGTQALVRVGSVDAIEIMRALDIGAAGIVVPVINNAEAARAAVAAVRYPPLGNRSYGPVRNFDETMFDREAICILMIETVEALENLDAIAATPGVDGLLLGPADLAVSMGLRPGTAIGPELWDAIDQIVAVCARYGIASGCATIGTDLGFTLVERGVSFVTIGADMGFMRQGAAEQSGQVAAWRARQKLVK